MRRYWGIDLRGLYSYPPTVSPDEVLWLYEQLPDNAATRRSPDGSPGEWELGTQLQAAVFNGIQANTHAFVAAHSKKAPPAPKLILPPSQTRDVERTKARSEAKVIHLAAVPDIGAPSKE